MKSKHAKKKNIKLRRFLFALLLIIILASIVYFGIYLIQTYFTNKSNKEIQDVYDSLSDQTSDTTLKIQELQKVNSDIVGWINIDGTKINYPVLQGTDNSYYMTHTYDKQYSSNGSVFLDKDYNWNLPSTNLLIYGHNNKNGTMFEELLKYEKESFYKEHPTIRFITNSEDSEFEIIAVFLSRVYYKSEKNVFRYYYFINAEDEKEFNDYIKNSKDSSLYDTGKTSNYGDQLLTLSTCSYHTEDGRFAIVARKIKR